VVGRECPDHPEENWSATGEGGGKRLGLLHGRGSDAGGTSTMGEKTKKAVGGGRLGLNTPLKEEYGLNRGKERKKRAGGNRFSKTSRKKRQN